MRLEPDEFDPVVGAAVAAGITVFDTARAYGDGERLLAGALRRAGAVERARIITKGGMARPGGTWLPDGRAKALRADCEASLAALDGLPIDLYLVHVPDPRVPWRTTVRALGRLAEEGLVARVGVSNVNRRQLDEALELAPVAAVQVAHSPLGGPKRAGRADGGETLAWLLGLSSVVVPLPGARRPETARASAAAAAAAPSPQRRSRRQVAKRTDADVVLVMGVPGAGKGRIAADYAERGYLRLNRDERGGSLRELAAALDRELAAGARALVLDNTYLSRASRNDVLEAAARHGASVRCVWLDTPLAQAQVNLVLRLLERFGELPAPVELRQLARREQGVLAPTSQMRSFRELEPPSADEGFAGVERVPFERAYSGGAAGVLVAARALSADGWTDAIAAAAPAAPHLVYDWNPDGDSSVLDSAVAQLVAVVTGPVEAALCPHPAGPPVCWCRPPLPGLPLAFARRHGIDLAASVVVGSGAAHKTLAQTLGARSIQV